jgi:hypothetical protein
MQNNTKIYLFSLINLSYLCIRLQRYGSRRQAAAPANTYLQIYTTYTVLYCNEISNYAVYLYNIVYYTNKVYATRTTQIAFYIISDIFLHIFSFLSVVVISIVVFFGICKTQNSHFFVCYSDKLIRRTGIE